MRRWTMGSRSWRDMLCWRCRYRVEKTIGLSVAGLLLWRLGSIRLLGRYIRVHLRLRRNHRRLHLRVTGDGVALRGAWLARQIVVIALVRVCRPLEILLPSGHRVHWWWLLLLLLLLEVLICCHRMARWRMLSTERLVGTGIIRHRTASRVAGRIVPIAPIVTPTIPTVVIVHVGKRTRSRKPLCHPHGVTS